MPRVLTGLVLLLRKNTKRVLRRSVHVKVFKHQLILVCFQKDVDFIKNIKLISGFYFSPFLATWLPALPLFRPVWSGRSDCKLQPLGQAPPAWRPALSGVAPPSRRISKSFRTTPEKGNYRFRFV
jgi:hypothetical protein